MDSVFYALVNVCMYNDVSLDISIEKKQKLFPKCQMEY